MTFVDRSYLLFICQNSQGIHKCGKIRSKWSMKVLKEIPKAFDQERTRCVLCIVMQKSCLMHFKKSGESRENYVVLNNFGNSELEVVVSKLSPIIMLSVEQSLTSKENLVMILPYETLIFCSKLNREAAIYLAGCFDGPHQLLPYFVRNLSCFVYV